MKLTSLILIGIIATSALAGGDCTNCAHCSTNGHDTWCNSCYKSSMTWTNYTQRTCGAIGSGITNCLVQTATDFGQLCTLCEDGYERWKLDDSSPHVAANGDGTCLKIKRENTVALKDRNQKTSGNGFSGSTKIESSAYYCKVGFYANGLNCEAIKTDNSQNQVPVDGCYMYSQHKCEQCNPGLDLITYKMNDLGVVPTLPAIKKTIIQACVERGDKNKGCLSVGGLGNCGRCDYRAGYYSKGVTLMSFSVDTQEQICTKETDGGTFGGFGML